MLSIDIMNKTLNRLRTFYSRVEILDINFREYYDVIKPAAYYSNNQIVFAFKFPILSPLTFSLYRLVIVPNKMNLAIIPPFPLLAITGKTHVYIEAECPKVSTQYLCEEKFNHQIRTHPDCISKIIEGQVADSSCKKTIVNLTKPAMEKLDDRQYIITFPNLTQVQLNCERDESISLSGSFLATIPQNCKLQTNEFTIININDRSKGKPMKITSISIKSSEDLSPPPPSLEIDTINLRKLHDLQDKINVQEPISTEPTMMLYHTTIPLYGIIAATIITICSFKIYRTYIHNKRGGDSNSNSDTPPTKMGESPSQSKPSAIFQCKTLK
ncbi:hypothetical protein K1T71_014556 [Dendrolimus kikuchii]|nr:hypothetical protein K1T71_014556 [Dendrolimus kikuchii]